MLGKTALGASSPANPACKVLKLKKLDGNEIVRKSYVSDYPHQTRDSLTEMK